MDHFLVSQTILWVPFTSFQALTLRFSFLLCSHLCGALGIYDVSKEKKIGVKTPHLLNVYDRIYHKVTTTDDPIIRDVRRGEGREERGGWGQEDLEDAFIVM